MVSNYYLQLKQQEYFIGFILICAILLSSPFFVKAQTATISTAVKPGSPIGSYSLTGFETINPYSGNLNFSLPLQNAGGRGKAASPVRLTLNQKYKAKWFYYPDGDRIPYVQDYYEDVSSDYYDNGYSPGKLIVQKNGFQANNYCSTNGGIYLYNYTLTLVTFTAPDGTDFTFRDRNGNGNINTIGPCQINPPSRGTVFETADGTSATFVSDSVIYDEVYPGGLGYDLTTSGFILLNNGTRYRIDNSKVSWQQDNNGNKITYEYTIVNGFSRISKITDSLNREINFEYGVQDITPYGLCDRITYKGFGGATRTVRISLKNLGDNLASGYSIQTMGQLFPDVYTSSCPQDNPYACGSAINNSLKPSAVWMPDGRSYKFKYNSYAELARVELPTGAAIEYDWVNGFGIGNSSLTGLTVPPYINVDKIDIYRRVIERRVYADGINLENRKTISGTDSLGNNQGYVIENEYDSNNHLLFKAKHYYNGIGEVTPSNIANQLYESWRNGREYQTDFFDSNGLTLLRRSTSTWQQSSPSWYSGPADKAPINNPHVVETTNLLAESNQVSKQTFSYDGYNNLTDTYEYEYDINTPGALVRRSHTDYITDSNYTDISGAYLRNLPSATKIYGYQNGQPFLAAQSEIKYDETPLESRTNVIGWINPNNSYRGNVTKTRSWLKYGSEPETWLEGRIEYDVLGNVIKTIDAKNNITQIHYTDRFGIPDGEARSNSAPAQLNGQSTFAFPTSATNAMGWITGYSQVDYYTGQSVDAEDINGVVNSTFYNDDLDRPTQSITANNLPDFKRQTNVLYDDENRRVETKADLNAFNDNLLKSESFYDGLGRTIKNIKYESGGSYIITESVPFVMVQDPETSVWRVGTKQSNPYRPGAGEQPVWTTALSDALGRPIKTITPDGAMVKTEYSGNTVTVTDQAGKKRRSVTNALGQLVRVDEPNDAGQLGTIDAPVQPTNYAYDTLNNLTTVSQGVQTRSFVYDSLSRLKQATNPESGIINYTYDNNGNLTQKKDARLVVTDYVYDNLNRVTNRNYSAPANLPNYQATPNVTYTYENATVTNLKGVMTKVTNGFSATEYTQFDTLGRVLKSRQTTDGTIYNGMEYVYNLSGAMVEEKYPSGRVVKNTLDADGDLSQVHSQKANGGLQNYANSFNYTAAGAVSSLRLGNGRWENTQFNSRLQPTQIGLGASATSQNSLKLDFDYGTTDNNGNVKSQQITVPTVGATAGFTAIQTYTYDSLNRIKDAKEMIGTNQQWKQTFQYDRYGNRRFDTANNNTTTLQANCQVAVCNPTIDPNTNKLIGYQFDNSGNTKIDANNRQFIYDAENKQVEVKDQYGTSIGKYFYDSDGKRVKKIVPNGETTIFIYDASGKMVAEYSTVIASTQDAKISYLTNDHLGSPRITTDANGQVISRRDFQPFGEEIARANYGGDSVRQKFTGYERDNESQLDFAQARMHNYNLGRFTSPDPSPESTDLWIPQSMNRYVYVMNNPLLYTDPTGLIWVQTSGCSSEACQPQWIPDEDWNNMSDDDRKPYEAVTNLTYDSVTGNQVILNPTGPNADNPSGWSFGGPNTGSGAGVMLGGAAVVAMSDTPVPGPMDILAVGVVVTAGVVYLIHEGSHQLPLDPNLYNKNKDIENNVNGLIAVIEEHLVKVANDPDPNDPKDPWGPRNHHEGEIRNWIKQCRDKLKRHGGGAKKKLLEKIDELEKSLDRIVNSN
jgi:RHS repeat-associated protein